MAATAADDGAKKPAAAAVTEEPGEQLRTTTAAAAEDVSILKQINRVNDDGSYTFGYEASDGSFKVETRDVAGNVKGMFGFVDEAGRLKRVSYSASNSSGFRAEPTAGQPRPETQTYKDDGEDGKSGSAVKKVLVSKRPVTVARADEPSDGRRGGNDPRRQLSPSNDESDVYGVHDRPVGPMSPVVSALMSELEPIIASSHRPQYDAGRLETSSISRQSQEDDEPVAPPYRQQQQPAAYRQQQTATAAAYPAALQLTPVAYQPVVGVPNLAALRDELMELILSVVQARVSQLVPVAPYPQPIPPAYPYQQANNYYVPGYYQGPAAQRFGGQHYRGGGDGHVAVPTSSPWVTQTLRDGLIRMLLSTSPRYDQRERVAGDRAPRLTYAGRQAAAAPVRSVQIVDDGGSDDSRPVTTESPD